MVEDIVEVDAITSVLNSQKNSGVVEDADAKVVEGRWLDSVKISEIISSILFFVTSPALSVVDAVVPENISAMRDFAVSTSVVSAKISEMISLIFSVVVSFAVGEISVKS